MQSGGTPPASPTVYSPLPLFKEGSVMARPSLCYSWNFSLDCDGLELEEKMRLGKSFREGGKRMIWEQLWCSGRVMCVGENKWEFQENHVLHDGLETVVNYSRQGEITLATGLFL